MNRPCLVTGVGCICAAGDDLAATSAALEAQRRRCAPPKAFTVDLPHTYPVFEIASDLDARLDPPPTQPLTRTSKLALIAAREALGAAGVADDDLRERRVGVCLGTTVGCTLDDEAWYRAFRAGQPPDLLPVERYVANLPADCVARELGVSGGPVATVADACASGTDAIGLARSWLRAGLCDLALAGGADSLSRIAYLGFIHLMVASEQPCRPFDRARSGLNLGEGAGVLVLESADSARRRDARPWACVAGYGCHADAWHATAPHPEGRGLRRALDRALDEAGVGGEDVVLVNAHGTATSENDRVEGRVLAERFPTSTAVVSTKGGTGHALGAAGAIEAVLTVRALCDRRAPATIGCVDPDPECVVRPTTRTVALDGDTAVSTSLAFGGGNSALVLRRMAP